MLSLRNGERIGICIIFPSILELCECSLNSPYYDISDDFQLAPFYLGHAVINLGTAKAVGLFSSLIGVGMFMVIACNIWGPKWRAQ